MNAVLSLYERSIKWGDYADARLLTEKPEPQERLDQYNAIKVISYDVIDQKIVGDFEQLNQVVEIKFYHEQQGTVKTVRDVQVWLYNKDRDTWVLKTGLPDFMSVNPGQNSCNKAIKNSY
ncbi:MAG: hypothetical protein L0Y39_12570 [Methylococcaceae bacterium]|nr:hypothetical protein [Methylococcaceae bacterium]